MSQDNKIPRGTEMTQGAEKTFSAFSAMLWEMVRLQTRTRCDDKDKSRIKSSWNLKICKKLRNLIFGLNKDVNEEKL